MEADAAKGIVAAGATAAEKVSDLSEVYVFQRKNQPALYSALYLSVNCTTEHDLRHLCLFTPFSRLKSHYWVIINTK
mgnify:CR=1 FL=1